MLFLYCIWAQGPRTWCRHISCSQSQKGLLASETGSVQVLKKYPCELAKFSICNLVYLQIGDLSVYSRNLSYDSNHFLFSFLSGRKGLLSMFPLQFPELQLCSDCFLDVKHSQAPITFWLCSAIQEPSQVNEWANLLLLRIKSVQIFFLKGSGRYGDWRGRHAVGKHSFFAFRLVGVRLWESMFSHRLRQPLL